MPSTIGALTALKVDKKKHPGMYADGGGLYLRVTANRTQQLGFPIHAERPAPLDGAGAAPHRQPR